MNLEAAIKSEIQKLFIVRYEKVNGKYKVILRNPKLDPQIDQVVDNIKTIFARYRLEQGV